MTCQSASPARGVPIASPGAGTLRRMIYQLYQAHNDMIEPLRAIARIAVGHLANVKSEHFDESVTRGSAPPSRSCRAVGLTHHRPAYGIETVTVGNREAAVIEEAADVDAVLHAAPFPQGRHAAAIARAAGGAAVRSFRHAAARHREDDAAGARCLSHRLAQCARRLAAPRPLRSRRICRASDPLPRKLGPGAHIVAICQPAVPALAAVALMAQDGSPAQPAQHDPDGRADRHAHQPDQGQ